LVALIEYFAWRVSTQTALRVAALAQRPEPATTWSVDEILVPEAELESPAPEAAELTTVLPPPTDEEADAEPERGKTRRRRRFRPSPLRPAALPRLPPRPRPRRCASCANRLRRPHRRLRLRRLQSRTPRRRAGPAARCAGTSSSSRGSRARSRGSTRRGTR